MMDDTRDIRRFLILAFGLGLSIQMAALRIGLETGGSRLLLLTMWTTAIAALLASTNTWRLHRLVED